MTLAAWLAFTATYAVSLTLMHLVSVYVFDYWEPSFGDQRGNVVVFLTAVLPFLLALASVSFLIGLRTNATFKRFDRRAATTVGTLSAIVTALLLIAVIAVNVFADTGADTAEIAAGFFIGPGLSAIVTPLLVEQWWSRR